VVDKKSVDFTDEATLKYGVPPYMYSYVMAWRAINSQEPNPRLGPIFGMSRNSRQERIVAMDVRCAEAALLADGVPMDKVYPIDEKRALNKIKELKPHVASFWELRS